MERLLWDKKYASGLIYLDNHRRNFIGIVNELVDTINMGMCDTMLPMIFHRLAFYVEDYFVKKEMALREAVDLPFRKYKEEHDHFTAQMIIFQERYRNGESGLCHEMYVFLVGWFENYIKLFDQSGVDFLRNKGYE